jgi:hypothetical protein
MDTLTETISTINEATGKAIATFQEQLLAFNRDVAAAFGRIELPSWLPTPDPSTEVNVDALVKQAYEFQAGRVEADKQFVLGLVDIWTQPVRKTTEKTSAK